MDYYDPDIEEKLKALEEEENKLLDMERDENELMEDEEDSDGVTEEELRKALKEVRGKKALYKLEHKMKKNLRARSKNKKLEDFEEHLEKKGIAANLDSLRARVKSRRSITDLEGAQDKLNSKAFDSDDSGDEAVDAERGGRKRRRSASSDEEMDGEESKSRKSGSKKGRSLTPA
jgi:nucleolar GTP-binding protein